MADCKDGRPPGSPPAHEDEAPEPHGNDSCFVEEPAPEEVPNPGDIEEGQEVYRPGGFHPVYIGEVYHDRYEILSKIGYGVYSTVWLVRDLQERENKEKMFRALKVLSAECYGQGNDTFEREILNHLRTKDQSFVGYPYVCHLTDDFEHQGPNGTHVCLVFELMGETLGSFGAWFPKQLVPNSVMRRFTIQLLCALDFAHECNVIHTDIKPDNIFVRVRDFSRIDDPETGYLADVAAERLYQQDKAEQRYTVVPSLPLRAHYFNEVQARRGDEFDVALGDWGVSSWADRHLTENIQPVALRSPEVLIKAPWDAKTDLWNLGAVILEVFRAVRMFEGRASSDGHYEARQHLAEIVNFFGPFPEELLRKGDQHLVRSFFDDEGQVKNADPVSRPGLSSEWFTGGLDDLTRDEFISFLREMMKINPAERPSPEELLALPWLDALRKPKGPSQG